MSYDTLRTDFLTMLNRRDCTNAMADSFIDRSIKRIQRTPKIPAQEKSITITINDDVYLTNGYLIIPTDYLSLKDITYINSAGEPTVLRKAPLDEVQRAVFYGVQGAVTTYVRIGRTWVFGAAPITGDSVRIDYYSEYSAVSQPTDDNILLDIAEDAVLYGALSYAGDRWNDKRTGGWEQRFVQIISDLQGQADDDDESGNAAVGQAFYYPPDHL
jgi:hypothetical protein